MAKVVQRSILLSDYFELIFVPKLSFNDCLHAHGVCEYPGLTEILGLLTFRFKEMKLEKYTFNISKPENEKFQIYFHL